MRGARPHKQWSEGAEQAVRDYDWPGNVRELCRRLRRIAAEGGPVVLASDLSDTVRLRAVDRELPSQSGTVPRIGVGGTEVQLSLPPDGYSADALWGALLAHALGQCDGNASAAARYLRMGRDAFVRQARRHGLWPPLRRAL